jgi:hypothetical protein
MATAGGAVAFDGGSSRHDFGRGFASRFLRVVWRLTFIFETDQYWAAIQSSEDSCRPITVRINISVAESVAFPPKRKGSLMPRTDISLDPCLTAIERPPAQSATGK